jgi:hypothetical protein
MVARVSGALISFSFVSGIAIFDDTSMGLKKFSLNCLILKVGWLLIYTFVEK